MAEAVFFNGYSVWATDGTSKATLNLPIKPDTGYSILSIGVANTENLFQVGKKLLFTDTEYDPQTNAYQYQIWTTDGTAAGTSVATTTSPVDRTLIGAVGGKALIYSTSSSSVGVSPTVSFVLTNGTAAGTTTFKVAGPPLPYGFSVYSSFYSLGNRVIFSATGKDGKLTLWSSNGTAAGTGPLKVSGVSSTNGLDPYDIVTVGAKAYFIGYGKDGQEGLWSTDGTAAGTKEIVLKNISSDGLVPSWLTAVGGKLFFSGYDSTFHSALWVTDGSAAGTHEVVVSGASQKGLSPIPGGLTAFDGKVIFTGLDANYNDGLFVSDGTTAGSYELSFSGSEPEGFFADGDRMFFEATDASGKAGLWVTDGSKKGTHEIYVKKSYAEGIFSGIPFSGINSGTVGGYEKNFAIVGNDVVFYGKDSLGRTGLWVTDGTSAGTKELHTNLTISDLTSVSAAAAAAVPSSEPTIGNTQKPSVTLFNQYAAAGFHSGDHAGALAASAEISSPNGLWHAFLASRA
jgi:ELWxxDGT repeat protein